MRRGLQSYLAALVSFLLVATNDLVRAAGEEVSLKIQGGALSGDCSLYELHKKPRRITKENNKYGLWPDLMSETDLETGEMLFGMEEAMEMIWRNQNPPDCKKAKYLLVDSWYQGYGSELHVFGLGLAVALDLGYVALQTGGWTWRFHNKFCEGQGKKSLECYYAPLSKCTIEDAMHVAYPNGAEEFQKKAENATHHWTAEEDQLLIDVVKKLGSKGHWNEVAANFPAKTSTQCYHHWFKNFAKTHDPNYQKYVDHDDIATVADIVTPSEGVYTVNSVMRTTVWRGGIELLPPHAHLPSNVLSINAMFLFRYRKFVPRMFMPMLKCTNMDDGAKYLWWRAIAATYYVRPNNATLALLEKERDPMLRDVRGKCISTYIRHGDKASEMQLVPTKTYLDTAMRIWNETLPPQLQSSPQKVFYIASDDFQAIEEARAWGLANQIAVRQSNLSQTVLSDKRQVIRQDDMEKHVPKSREMEYFSYILHLADTVYCEASICTWPSNYCRVIDELRTTVGGKANKIFADLSSETCSSPPCIRNYGLGNYQGSLFDPKQILWR